MVVSQTKSAAFSHTGQTYGELKAFVKEQVRHKLIDFEGRRGGEKLKD